MFNIIEVLVGLLASAVLYSQILKDYLKEGKLLIGV